MVQCGKRSAPRPHRAVWRSDIGAHRIHCGLRTCAAQPTLRCSAETTCNAGRPGAEDGDSLAGGVRSSSQRAVHDSAAEVSSPPPGMNGWCAAPGRAEDEVGDHPFLAGPRSAEPLRRASSHRALGDLGVRRIIGSQPTRSGRRRGGSAGFRGRRPRRAPVRLRGEPELIELVNVGQAG